MNLSLDVGRWKGQLVMHSRGSLQVPVRLLGFRAAFSKMVITPCSEVKMASHLMGVKLDLTLFPGMCSMHHGTS